MTPTMTNGMLILAASSTTVEPTTKRIEILAYGGGFLRIGGWGLVAVDLSGLELGAQTPLIAAHGNDVGDVIGHGQAVVRGGKLFVEGLLALVTGASREVYELGLAGFGWQASIGVETISLERVAAGETRRVNGQTLKASESWTLTTRGRLREISILPVGADWRETAVKIAAGGRMGREKDMDGKKGEGTDTLDSIERQRIEAVAENERIAAIRKLSGDEHGEIKARAIVEGWAVERAETELLRARVQALELEKIRRERATPPGVHGSVPPLAGAGVTSSHVLAAAFLGYWGQGKVAEKHFDARTLEEAHGLRARSLADICAEALRAEYRDVPRTAAAVIRAAFSTSSLAVALGSSAEKIMLEGYNDSPPTWRSFAMVGSLSNFRAAKTIRPSFSGELGTLPPGGNIDHGYLEEETGDIALELYAQVYAVDYRSMVNDDANLFSQAPARLGKNAMRKVSDVVYGAVLGNADDFFSVAHNNLLTGADTALSVSALSAAITAMLTQRDATGRDLDLIPAVLVLPPELREIGVQVLESEAFQRYVCETVDQAPMGNPFRGITLAIEPRLSNGARFPDGYSTTAWYLMGRPADAPVHVAFLDGSEVPRIEFFDPSHEAERLAYTWRVYIAVGAALGDYRAAIKATGAAE